jgi:hypothetical protein
VPGAGRHAARQRCDRDGVRMDPAILEKCKALAG